VATHADADPLADTQEHELRQQQQQQQQQQQDASAPAEGPSQEGEESGAGDQTSCRHCGRPLQRPGRPRIFRRPETAARCERCHNLYCRDHALRITGLWRSLRSGPKYLCAFCLSGTEGGVGHSPTTKAPRAKP
jgi:hypothetical protein